MQKDLGRVATFKDHFSSRSAGYARHRPSYPDTLFQFLNDVTPQHAVAWDCATGSGQAAISLAKCFQRVVATDASESQIAAAIANDKVSYRVAPAEASGLEDASIDLLTVGQAFHWFDHDAFLEEACRVLTPEGVLAIWCYETCQVTTACDAIIDHLYDGIVGAYWPPERVIIEQGYAGIELPGTAVDVPEISMSASWHATDMLGYLRTWSACKRYEADNGSDPVARIEAQLRDAWGADQRAVRWPLKLKVSRANSLLE